jgi:hypothetical protein
MNDQQPQSLRRRFLTAELSEQEAQRIASSRMEMRHDHLNALLDGETEFEALKKDARRRRVGLTTELPEEWIEALQQSEL